MSSRIIEISLDKQISASSLKLAFDSSLIRHEGLCKKLAFPGSTMVINEPYAGFIADRTEKIIIPGTPRAGFRLITLSFKGYTMRLACYRGLCSIEELKSFVEELVRFYLGYQYKKTYVTDEIIPMCAEDGNSWKELVEGKLNRYYISVYKKSLLECTKREEASPLKILEETFKDAAGVNEYVFKNIEAFDFGEFSNHVKDAFFIDQRIQTLAVYVAETSKRFSLTVLSCDNKDALIEAFTSKLNQKCVKLIYGECELLP